MTWPEARVTDTGLLVLHTLRCAGTISLARLHAITGLDESDAESELIDLGADGLVTRLSGDIPGWSLTDALAVRAGTVASLPDVCRTRVLSPVPGPG
ncbi:hypothetical protein [Streptomyces marianii]|uniref:hypothetical protein n=1 Tax=Streptomyces marianii TaxID=1817406 RepID=UPI001F41C934|nr:hypothetical protein [Streptomyces marianii]